MTQPALLDTIEHETAPQPRWTIVWLHGLGADGHDFAQELDSMGEATQTLHANRNAGPLFAVCGTLVALRGAR